MQKNTGSRLAAPAINYRKRVLLLIFLLSALRLIICFSVELANDESYYWLYSQHLKWNYFDHPPMIALVIRLFTLDLSLQNYPGFIRLGSVVCCAAATWFMYKCVAQLHSERAGWLAALLYGASFYAGITAGILAMPDTPQMVFWTLGLWLLARLTFNDSLFNWLLFGLCAGLCIMSKVHGVFLWIGVALYALFYRRNWLAKPGFYIALLVTVLICLPILFWNIKYHFATYSFNSRRVDMYGSAISWRSYFFQVSQEIGVANPFNFSLIVLAFFGWRKCGFKNVAALKIYNFIGVPFALILLYLPLFRDNILPHWSGPAYVALIPLAAMCIAEVRKNRFLPVVASVSLVNYVFYLIVCTLLILYYPGTFGKTEKPFLGTNDLTIDFYGWKEGGRQFDSLYAADVRNKIVPANTPLICYKWWGAHVEYYFCRPLGIKMIGLGEMMDIHEYLWMNRLRQSSVNIDNAYCIVSSDEYFNPKLMYKNYYAQINLIKTIRIPRGGKPAHDFYVYRLQHWKGILPAIQ